MSASSSISSNKNLWISFSIRLFSSSCTGVFLFFLTVNFCELSIFPEGGFLSPPPWELLLSVFLIGWAVESLLPEITFLGVTTGC
jgi:hypothetical protein